MEYTKIKILVNIFGELKKINPNINIQFSNVDRSIIFFFISPKKRFSIQCYETDFGITYSPWTMDNIIFFKFKDHKDDIFIKFLFGLSKISNNNNMSDYFFSYLSFIIDMDILFENPIQKIENRNQINDLVSKLDGYSMHKKVNELLISKKLFYVR